MTIAPVSHSSPEGKEKEKEEKEKEQEKKKEKKKVKKKAKDKKKKKEKKVDVVSCDVKQQYPFEGFNIDGEGPTELMASFSQWINKREGVIPQAYTLDVAGIRGPLLALSESLA
ncbi:hypothetical protein KY285_004743 [Solanum tuberosum]|nr:hypothetical protein KY285_004743 [Solanum tuberosum]